MSSDDGRVPLALTLNGIAAERPVDPASTLAEALRDDFGLSGVRIGCANGDCGTCTAMVAGVPVKTCLMLVQRAEDATVWTLEGIGTANGPTAMQEAFVAAYGFQCGFCLPGMIFAAQALLDRDPNPPDPAIRDAVSGNICRCTGYHNVVVAVRRAAGHQEPTDELTDPPLTAEQRD